MILSDWDEINGSLQGLDMKNREEELKRPSDKPWDVAPTRAPRESLSPSGSGTSHQQNHLGTESIRQALALTPLRAPKTHGDHVLPSSFRTSSQVMYPHFLVDSNTLRYI